MSAEQLCQHCESELEAGDLRCPVCSASRPADVEVPREPQARVLRCTDCNAVMHYDARQQAAACPFCDSKLALEWPPDPIEEAQEYVPFKVTSAQASAAFRAWLGKRAFFAPGDLEALARIGEAKQVMWAAWVLSAHAQVHLTADEHGAGRNAPWGPTVRSFELPLKGVLVPASRGLAIEEIAALERYDANLTFPTPPPGALLEDFGVTRSAARQAIVHGVHAGVLAKVSSLTARQLRNPKLEVLLSKLRTRRVLLPAWVAAYRYRGKQYRVVVHGQNAASVTGQRPTSWLRVLAAGALALLVLALLLQGWPL
jgi:hypothetical protein